MLEEGSGYVCKMPVVKSALFCLPGLFVWGASEETGKTGSSGSEGL